MPNTTIPKHAPTLLSIAEGRVWVFPSYSSALLFMRGREHELDYAGHYYIFCKLFDEKERQGWTITRMS